MNRSTLFLKFQKGADFIYTATEAWNQATVKPIVITKGKSKITALTKKQIVGNKVKPLLKSKYQQIIKIKFMSSWRQISWFGSPIRFQCLVSFKPFGYFLCSGLRHSGCNATKQNAW